jgi:hypothetical protein
MSSRFIRLRQNLDTPNGKNSFTEDAYVLAMISLYERGISVRPSRHAQDDTEKRFSGMENDC